MRKKTDMKTIISEQKVTHNGYIIHSDNKAIFNEFEHPMSSEDMGDGCIEKFLKVLVDLSKFIGNKIKNKPEVMRLTSKEIEQHRHATKCYLCGGEFKDNEHNKQKCMDHCHITGSYRGPAHRDCNYHLKDKIKIPVIAHNSKGYDAHFIFQAIESIAEKITEIQVIPETNEKYKTFKFKIISNIFMIISLHNIIYFFDRITIFFN